MADYPATEVCIVCQKVPAVGTLVIEVGAMHSQWSDKVIIRSKEGFVCLSHLNTDGGI